ncbi:hypothetical protein CCACVL1_09939, partial [Corchorus capsularis]
MATSIRLIREEKLLMCLLLQNCGNWQ